MSAVNPYMPPRAQVADVLDPASEYQPVKIFSWRGRIGRLRYLAYSALGYFAMFVAAMVLGIVAAVSAQPAFVALIPLLVTVPYFAFLVMLSVQRSHDMGWSGWSTLLLIVPLAPLVWVFNRGCDGENRYGAPPPPNTLGVKLGALALPVVMIVFIGILAAVAIPAYQQYTIRAKAAQVR